MKISLIIISCLFFLSSCASIYKLNDSILNKGSRYKEPDSGKIAHVRVFYGVGKSIYIYPNSLTKKDLSKDKDSGLAFTNVTTMGFMKRKYTPKSLGMPYAPENADNFGEFKIPADRPIIVQMTYGYNDGQRYEFCPLKTFKVTFEEHKNYALIMNTNSGCTYEFYEYKNNEAIRMTGVEKL
ncbi:hypothetical protein [Acinetobacter nosocomialis]|uniref:hypothetical protein n=1 Tax=Acinetobacter nosocomialis TaxID=106654 RepID=UPI001B845967|nr:hypothetical protein [Acinetobacter nosocomialis]MBR7682736.1 hypothetical protein [Acinetobacter nosocomialis]